jgi:hypothetical protein
MASELGCLRAYAAFNAYGSLQAYINSTTKLSTVAMPVVHVHLACFRMFMHITGYTSHARTGQYSFVCGLHTNILYCWLVTGASTPSVFIGRRPIGHPWVGPRLVVSARCG